MNYFRHLLGSTSVSAVNTAEGKQRILLLLLQQTAATEIKRDGRGLISRYSLEIKHLSSVDLYFAVF